MEQARVTPPLMDDLVRCGIDVGYRRGRRRGLKRGLAQGSEQELVQGGAQGLQQAPLATHAARRGEVPAAVVAAVEATQNREMLPGWQAIFATRSARGIAVAVGAGGRRRQG